MTNKALLTLAVLALVVTAGCAEPLAPAETTTNTQASGTTEIVPATTTEEPESTTTEVPTTVEPTTTVEVTTVEPTTTTQILTTTTTTVPTPTTTPTPTPTPTATPTPTTVQTTVEQEPLREFKITVHTIEEVKGTSASAEYQLKNWHEYGVTLDFDILFYHNRLGSDKLLKADRHSLSLDPGQSVIVYSTYSGNETADVIDYAKRSLSKR